jgi:hypothetical protein
MNAASDEKAVIAERDRCANIAREAMLTGQRNGWPEYQRAAERIFARIVAPIPGWPPTPDSNENDPPRIARETK